MVIYGSKEYLQKHPRLEVTIKTETEKRKWDNYYASLPLLEEDEVTSKFNLEFAKCISELLPQGSSVLEAGCGGGWQSIALARLGKYETNLMDFSPEALKYAQKLFARENLPANFICENVITENENNLLFDLVFNAGVLEHYDFEQQVAFLKGMTRRSRKYILVMVPNRLCYWYWLWRIQKSSEGEWPFGKEVPLIDLAEAFKAAGLNFLGQTFMGETWAEAFITGFSGLSQEAQEQLLTIHRSPVIPESQKCYLIAALGSVAPNIEAIPSRWNISPSKEEPKFSTVYAALSDALALRIGAERTTQILQAGINEKERVMQTQQQELIKKEEKVQILQAGINEKERVMQTQQQELIKKEEKVKKLEGLAKNLTEEKESLLNRLRNKENELIQASAQKNIFENKLNQIYTGDLWKLASVYFRIKDNTPLKYPHKFLSIWRRQGLGTALRKVKGRLLSSKKVVKKTKIEEEIINIPLTKKSIYRSIELALAFFGVMRMHGVHYALTKVKKHLLSKSSRSREIYQELATNQEHYLMEQSAQSTYLRKYAESRFDSDYFDCFHEHFALQIKVSTKVMVYLLSYPRELTQRPDHVIRYFAQNGYLCIVISIDNKDRFIQEISSNIYITNIYAEIISYVRGKKPVLYLTYPFFSYIIGHMPDAIVVYDTLDDLSVFSLYCEAMMRDHKVLLARCDVALFSSKALLNKNMPYVVNEPFLVTNGVWADDFKLDPTELDVTFYQKPEGSFLIGYHGAISELLDWELLEKILQDKRIWIYFIGSITRFDESFIERNAITQQRVLSSDHVIHIPAVPYSELKYYLRLFDAGIIPFIVNDKTNPVSPLKLFEYMAMGLKVFATPTQTLSEYAEFITVADRTMLPTIISKWVDDIHDNEQVTNSELNYDTILKEVDWGNQLTPVLKKVEELLNDPRPRCRQTKRVDIVNVNFFDWDGVVLYKGGAERYIFDLACILKEMGWTPRILQNANNSFEVDFHGIPVVGMKTGYGYNLREMSRKYRGICRDADLIITSPLDLACELWDLNVIGINHGIYWDNKNKTLSNFNLTDYRNVFDALKVVRMCICVDTNFINWVRTYDYELSGKLSYVPNYFDKRLFNPVDKDFTGKIRFLYPRRLYEARGIFVTLKAFDYLFDKYKDITLYLVGQANLEDAKVVSGFVDKYPGKIIWKEVDMDEMHKFYKTSHIVLIPTMYAEGTSLSCLEAMATRNAIIATNVGGLSNLVIDGFNGCLIEPNVESLVKAIELFLGDRNQIADMAARGIQLASVFEKERWARRWQNIINEVA